MLKFEDPVRMQVSHEKYGKCEVKAYCLMDAKLQASSIWGAEAGEMSQMRVAVETAALRENTKEEI